MQHAGKIQALLSPGNRAQNRLRRVEINRFNVQNATQAVAASATLHS